MEQRNGLFGLTGAGRRSGSGSDAANNSTYLNLSELEKIRHLIQIDLLDESQQLPNLSIHYGLPLLSNTPDEVQNHENPLLSKHCINVQVF